MVMNMVTTMKTLVTIIMMTATIIWALMDIMDITAAIMGIIADIIAVIIVVVLAIASVIKLEWEMEHDSNQRWDVLESCSRSCWSLVLSFKCF